MMLGITKIKLVKILGLLFILGLVLIFGLYYSLKEGYIRFNYPSYTEYPVRGIDVSNHQGNINWDVLDSTDVQFAFIKATEGGDFKDRSFVQNWEGAGRNKIKRSAYHFFTFCRSGSEQAINFIETVPNERDMLPPAIDLEYSGNCKLIKSRDELLEDIDNYIQIIEAEYNRKVIIYVTEKFYNDYLVGLYPDNPFWVRDVFKEAHVKDERDWLFWQFANTGRLDGIPTLVDMNVFRGDTASFGRFVNSRIVNP